MPWPDTAGRDARDFWGSDPRISPKSETRNPKEIRSPKREKAKVGRRSYWWPFVKFVADFWISVFGFPSDFCFRISDLSALKNP
jgi:hypothetical protein